MENKWHKPEKTYLPDNLSDRTLKELLTEPKVGVVDNSREALDRRARDCWNFIVNKNRIAENK